MSARALLERLTADGFSVRLDGNDVRLAVEPPRKIDRALIDEIRAAKAEVVEELRRLSEPISADDRERLAAEEWRITGCARFTTLRDSDDAREARYGACLACGVSALMHGSPTPSAWRRVADLDDVELVATRFVLASAAAIAREARQ
jgi:hypothetical protein